MSVQSWEYVITNASILKDLISAHVWKDMSLNHHELVDRKVVALAWIVICIVEKELLFHWTVFYCRRRGTMVITSKQEKHSSS